MKPGDAFKTHAEVERDRTYPTGCGGRFVCAANDGVRPAELECDGCGALLGLPQRAIVAGWGAPSGPLSPPVPASAPDGQDWAEF